MNRLKKLRLRLNIALAGHSDRWQSGTGVCAQPGGSTRGVFSFCLSEPTPYKAGLSEANPAFALKRPSIWALAELPKKWGKVPGKFTSNEWIS